MMIVMVKIIILIVNVNFEPVFTSKTCELSCLRIFVYACILAMAHASQVAHVQPRVFITTKDGSMLRQVESTWHCDDRVRALPLRVLGGQWAGQEPW